MSDILKDMNKDEKEVINIAKLLCDYTQNKGKMDWYRKFTDVISEFSIYFKLTEYDSKTGKYISAENIRVAMVGVCIENLKELISKETIT
jgi:hypothetical protein